MPVPDLSQVFPPSPLGIPPGLTAPSKAYTRHARLAMLGLLGFVGVYLGMTGYLGWVVYRLLGTAIVHHGNVIAAGLLSLPALFFLSFLVRGLFVVTHRRDESLVEITAQTQPTLFAFLHRLADETGAQRPHRVYASGRVNAAVFYELSFRNLLFPSKKNLELGVGLVNVLTLDELKAVVAHEFGHFAQRSMAVGRWVYIAQQIAAHIVTSRGIFDRFLAGVSRFDIRIAWVGWIFRLFVWAIRAILDTVFRIAVIAHRALGREMEFQADRVAVSVSGSDSLVHALHRLGPADEAWEEAVAFAVGEAHAGRPVDDVCALQTAALGHLRHILDEPDFGATPKRPEVATDHRVFQKNLAQPPRMWATHPPNRDREDSAKETYVPSTLDTRSAWVLFDAPDALRRQVSTALLAKEVRPPAATATAPAPLLERFEKRFRRTSLDPRYRGAYLGRAIAAYDASPAGMVAPATGFDRRVVLERLDSLYPTSLRAELESYRQRHEEESLLEGLVDGVLTAPGGVVRYRGRDIRRRELPTVVESVKAERRDIELRILQHDRSCRALHLNAARHLGGGWAEYLQGTVGLLHFATQQARNIRDARGHLSHVLAIAFADRRVSNAERKKVISSGENLHTALWHLWQYKPKLMISADLQPRFQAFGGWGALAKPFTLGNPGQQNLGQWLEVIDDWCDAALGPLSAINLIALDALLDAENQVAQWLKDEVVPPPAPAPSLVPASYITRVVGTERPRQKKLGWWDRFQTADGLIPGVLRVAVACALLLPALMIGASVGSSTIYVLNGLERQVRVKIGDHHLVIGPHSLEQVSLHGMSHAHVVTRNDEGRVIEELDVDVGGGFASSGYNVAQAASLVEWTQVYEAGAQVPDRPLGAPRWFEVTQQYAFTQPPRTTSSKALSASVIGTAMSESPQVQLSLVTDADEAAALVASHVRYDPLNAPQLNEWIAVAATMPLVRPALLERAAQEPGSAALHAAIARP